MTRWIAGALAATLLATSAWAQSEAFLLEPGSILRVSSDPPAVISSSAEPSGGQMLSPYVTPDGRLLIWMVDGASLAQQTPGRVAVRDLVLGTTATLDVPGAVSMLGNRARAEVYFTIQNGLTGTRVVAANAFGFRNIDAPFCTSTFPLGTSGDGQRLLIFCSGDGTPSHPTQDLVIDVDTGQVVATLPWSFQASLNRNGSEAYAVVFDLAGYRLRRLDVATGAQLAEAPVLLAWGPWSLHWDHRSNRVVMAGPVILAFDGTSLQSVGSATLPFTALSGVDSSSLDEAYGRLYATAVVYEEGFTYFSYLVYDTDTLTRVVYVPFTRNGRFVAVPQPLAPTGLTAAVAAGRVTLQWAPQPSNVVTTRYVVEAGTGPGLTDIVGALDVGLQTSLSASGVPPGTYYVRVRAGNYAGLSAPSNEVMVSVP